MGDISILASVTLERARVEWTDREPIATELKIYPWRVKLLNPMIVQSHANLRELVRLLQFHQLLSQSPMIATVTEPKMSWANKREHAAKVLTNRECRD